MNRLFLGLKRDVKPPKKGGYLLIHDEVRATRGAKVFDPMKHSFNPLEKLNYRKSCDLIDTFDALFTRGESTLTKDTGLDFIAEQLDGKTDTLETLILEPDKKSSTGHVWAYGKVRRLLRSPLLSRMLCSPTNFSFNPRSVIFARVNRAELGEFDALAVGLFLIGQYGGQVVLPDAGFYLRQSHTTLLRQGRLIAGVNTLSELPPKLLQAALLVPDKVGSGTTHEDAEVLAQYKGYARGTQGFTDEVSAAMA